MSGMGPGKAHIPVKGDVGLSVKDQEPGASSASSRNRTVGGMLAVNTSGGVARQITEAPWAALPRTRQRQSFRHQQADTKVVENHSNSKQKRHEYSLPDVAVFTPILHSERPDEAHAGAALAAPSPATSAI